MREKEEKLRGMTRLLRDGTEKESRWPERRMLLSPCEMCRALMGDKGTPRSRCRMRSACTLDPSDRVWCQARN